MASARVVEPEAELRVGLAGGDRGVRVAGDVGRDAQLDRLGARRRGRRARSSLSRSSKLSTTTSPMPGVERLAQLGLALGVAVQVDPLGRRRRPCSASASSPPEATSQPRPSSANSRRTAVHGNAFVAKTSDVRSCERSNAARNARARAAQVVLGDDVGGRAELAGELERVAAADLQAPALVEGGADRVDVRELLGHDGHGGQRVCRRNLRTVSIDPPELGRRDGLAYALFARGAAGRGRDHPRRGLGEGEPLRLRPQAARARLAAVLLRPARPRRERGRARARACSTTSRRWPRCSPTGRSGCAARRWAAGWRSPRPQRVRRRGGRRDLPGDHRGLLRGLQERRFAFRADVGRRRDGAGQRRPRGRRARPRRAPAAPARRGRRDRAGRGSRAACTPPRRAAGYVVAPGGHHRSIQHDAEYQALSLRFLERALGR